MDSTVETTVQSERAGECLIIQCAGLLGSEKGGSKEGRGKGRGKEWGGRSSYFYIKCLYLPCMDDPKDCFEVGNGTP